MNIHIRLRQCKIILQKQGLILLSFALTFYSAFTHAQGFGINTTGTTPNASAGLDVDFTNKGILIPRVALNSLTDAVTIANPATSLLVYSKGGSLTDGYYYNSGTPGSPVWSSFVTTASTSTGCFTNWQLFTANGTFTVPVGITKIKVCVYGGGGGGGGGNSNTGGGGGGAGGYVEGIYAVVPLSGYTVTIGSGGTGGLASGGWGANGGSSGFGALISVNGGLAGTSYFLGGAGGIGSGGYLNTSLGNGGGGSAGGGTAGIAAAGTGGGGSGALSNTVSGAGGGGGGGGIGGGNGGYSTSVGFNAQPNTGAGGGGGAGGATANNGGNGAAGKIIVFW